MSIRNALYQVPQTFRYGVDNTSDINSKDVVGTLSVGNNVDLVDDSLLTKRLGYTQAFTTWPTKVNRDALDHTYYSSGQLVTKTFVYGEDLSITGTSGAVGILDSLGAFTQIASGLYDSYRPSMVQFEGLLFFFNGHDDFVYDGAAKHQIGIDAPASAPTVSSYTTGALDTNGNYVGVYTYYNSVTGAESSPSLASSIINTGVNTGIVWSVTPGNAALADQIRFYRTYNSGDTFFYEDTVAIGSTTFTSIIEDAGLSFELELDNSRPPLGARFAVVADNAIFLAGFADNPNRVIWSKVGQFGPMPQSFQLLDFEDCNPNDGDAIVGLNVTGGTVVVLKSRSVGKLVRLGGTDRTVSLGGYTKYVFQELSRSVTGLSHQLMQSLDDKLVWLGRDDIYGTNGAQVVRLGAKILNTIRTLNFLQVRNFSSFNKLNSRQIFFSVVRSGKTLADLQIVGHYKWDYLAFTFYCPGSNETTHPGLRASSLFSRTVDNITRYFFNHAEATGKVYEFDKTTSDDGKGIAFDVRFPWDFTKYPAYKKLFHSFYAFAYGNGNLYQLTVSFESDFETLSTQSTFISSGDVTPWDGGVWDGFNWSAVRFSEFKSHPHKRAYVGRYGIQNYNPDEPIAFKSVSSVTLLDSVH